MSLRRARAARLLVALLPLALLAALLRDALAPGALLLRRDALLLYLPLKQFLAEQLSAWRWPTWYPYDGLGVSYVGSSVPGVFHPLNALVLLLPADQAMKWQSLLSLAIAALGAGRLAAALGAPRAGQALAALGYGASGYLLSATDNLPYVLSASALPWTLLAAERLSRRPGAATVGWMAAALLFVGVSGDVQGALLQALAAAVVVGLGRARARLAPRGAALLAAGVLAAIAALPLLLPTWATFRASARSGGMALADALSWSLHPARLLELAIGPLVPPRLLLDAEPVAQALGGRHGSFWAMTEFVGMPLCALALLALVRRLPRRLKVHAGLAAVALALALGPAVGLYGLLHRFVPLWSAFRYPEKLMPFAVLGLALLAGWGVRRLGRADRRATLLLVAGMAATIVLLALASPDRVHAYLAARLAPSDLPDPAALASRLRALLVVAALLLACLAALSVRRGRKAGWIALGLEAAQVLALSSWAVVVGPRAEWLAVRSPFEERARAEVAGGAGRMCWRLEVTDFAHPPGGGDAAQFFQATRRTMGVLTSASAGVGQALTYGPGGDGFFAGACGWNVKCPSACSRVAGAGIGVVDDETFAALPAERRAELDVLARQDDPHSVLFKDPLARPFASLPAVRWVGASGAREAIFAEGRRPAAEAILVGEGSEAPAARGTLTARRVQPDRVEAEAVLESPGWAVFALACTKGWGVRVDGAPATLERADGSLCAVMLPAGSHRIELDYVPWGWPRAFAGPVLAVAGWAVWRRRERRGPPAPESGSR